MVEGHQLAEQRGAGYVHTTDQIANYPGRFPGAGSSRVLVLEAGAGTFDVQTDFYVQFGDGDGAIGQIPPDHWFQFWLYLDDFAISASEEALPSYSEASTPSAPRNLRIGE